MSGKFIDITAENFAKYDLFCKKSQKNAPGYQSKVEWIGPQFKQGLKFKLLHVKEPKGYLSRGMIEYIPGEITWRGISAPNYMVIHCIWVVGRQKKKGYGTKLLKFCIEDAKAAGKDGVAVVTTNKTWLPKDPIFKINGFKTVDTFAPHLSLMVLKFNKKAQNPSFRYHTVEEALKESTLPAPSPTGITVYHGNQCPYMIDFKVMLEEIANELGVDFLDIPIRSLKDAKSCPHPFGICAVFFNGKFLTYTYETRKKYVQIFKSLM
jgi:GNAT superfamily N-acetyltransferase